MAFEVETVRYNGWDGKLCTAAATAGTHYYYYIYWWPNCAPTFNFGPLLEKIKKIPHISTVVEVVAAARVALLLLSSFSTYFIVIIYILLLLPTGYVGDRLHMQHACGTYRINFWKNARMLTTGLFLFPTSGHCAAKRRQHSWPLSGNCI